MAGAGSATRATGFPSEARSAEEGATAGGVRSTGPGAATAGLGGTTSGGGAVRATLGEGLLSEARSAKEDDGFSGAAGFDVDGTNGAGTTDRALAGGVCVGGGGVAAAGAGTTGFGAGGTGRDATRGAGLTAGSGGAKNAISSDRPTKPIATADAPYTSSIRIETSPFC